MAHHLTCNLRAGAVLHVCFHSVTRISAQAPERNLLCTEIEGKIGESSLELESDFCIDRELWLL